MDKLVVAWHISSKCLTGVRHPKHSVLSCKWGNQMRMWCKASVHIADEAIVANLILGKATRFRIEGALVQQRDLWLLTVVIGMAIPWVMQPVHTNESSSQTP